MAHITQCPACSTRFRVVDDQLKISEGWVRCGRCGEVFDGRQALVAEPPPSVPPPVPPAAQAAPELLASPGLDSVAAPAAFLEQAQAEPPLAPLSHTLAGQGVHAGHPVGDPESLPTDLTGVAESPLPPAGADGGSGAGVEVDIDLDIDLDMVPPDEAASVDIEIGDDGALHEATFSPEFTHEFTPAGLGEGADPGAEADADWSATLVASALPLVAPLSAALPASPQAPSEALTEVSFVRAARRQAFWAQTWVQAVLGALALLLLLGLAAQALWHERDRVAAAVPALKPWLVAACEPLGCEVGHWRHIESIRLEGTALVRLQDGAYRLEVGLTNTADWPVALPALELSLTNVRDDVVLRRVILASEWVTPAEVLPPLGNLNLNVNLSVTDSETLRTSGYRALVFYP